MSSKRKDPKDACPGTTADPRWVVDFERFRYLHEDGRRLIRGWLRHAAPEGDRRATNSFERFIFLWIAYNGWTACVSELDREWKQNEAMAACPELNSRFIELMESDDDFADAVKKFHALWPVFSAKDLRPKRLDVHHLSRSATIALYHANDIAFAPRCCYQRHLDREAFPMDWPHTLAAAYQVRCNLFHGEKSLHLDADHAMVDAALHALLPFVTDRIASYDDGG